MMVSFQRASFPGRKRKAVYGRVEILHSRDMGSFIMRTKGFGPRQVSQICQRSSFEPCCRLMSRLVCDTDEPPKPPLMPAMAG